jgi:hypothetical protein
MISGITLAITANALPSQAACSLRPKNLPPSDLPPNDPPPVRSRQPRASSVHSPEALHQTPNLKPLASITASLSRSLPFYPQQAAFTRRKAGSLHHSSALFSRSSSLFLGLFWSLCSILHTRVLCFQHLLSTLQKNACLPKAGHCICSPTQIQCPQTSNLEPRASGPVWLSFALFAVFCTLPFFVFNIFYLHCKKTPACRRQGTAYLDFYSWN